MPYRDYTVEYPPLAVPLFVIPRLATRQFETYILWFAAEMLLFDALAVYLVARRTAACDGPRAVPGRLLWYTASFAALYPVIGSRYDMAAAAVAFAGAVGWFGGRPVLGGLLTAAGTLMKIFPAVVAVQAAAAEVTAARSTRFRGLLVFAAAATAGGAAWFSLGGAASAAYHLGRGLQIETMWAGALMMVDKILGVALGWRFSHTSVELAAAGAGLMAAIAIPVQGAMLACAVWRFRHSGTDEPLRYAAAAVLAFIVPGKVLSPQYLIWLIPFVHAIDGKVGQVARRLFLVSCAATTLEYVTIGHLLSFEPWAIGLLNLRNAVLVVLFALLL